MNDDVLERARAESTGGKPKFPWAAVVPELLVTDIGTSLDFWCGALGFRVAFDRPAAKFAYLERGAAQIMLCERNGRWETAEMRPPFGRGVNLQIAAFRIAPILAELQQRAYPLYEAATDCWYRVGDKELGQREVLVQDPDGYLLRFVEDIGERPIGTTMSDAAGESPVTAAPG